VACLAPFFRRARPTFAPVGRRRRQRLLPQILRIFMGTKALGRYFSCRPRSP
jgi:hypothetical protein